MNGQILIMMGKPTLHTSQLQELRNYRTRQIVPQKYGGKNSDHELIYQPHRHMLSKTFLQHILYEKEDIRKYLIHPPVQEAQPRRNQQTIYQLQLCILLPQI